MSGKWKRKAKEVEGEAIGDISCRMQKDNKEIGKKHLDSVKALIDAEGAIPVYCPLPIYLPETQNLIMQMMTQDIKKIIFILPKGMTSLIEADGYLSDLYRKEEILKQANLKIPMLSRLFLTLIEDGLIADDENILFNFESSVKYLRKILG